MTTVRVRVRVRCGTCADCTAAAAPAKVAPAKVAKIEARPARPARRTTCMYCVNPECTGDCKFAVAAKRKADTPFSWTSWEWLVPWLDWWLTRLSATKPRTASAIVYIGLGLVILAIVAAVFFYLAMLLLMVPFVIIGFLILVD
jgi:hypothetical protein